MKTYKLFNYLKELIFPTIQIGDRVKLKRSEGIVKAIKENKYRIESYVMGSTISAWYERHQFIKISDWD